MNDLNHLVYVTILPEIILTIVGMVVMLADAWLDPKASRRPLGYTAFAGVVLALGAAFHQISYIRAYGFFQMVVLDQFSIFFHIVVLTIAALVLLFSLDYLDVQQIRAGEYYGLVLFGTVGMGLMASSVELVMLFIALEISSIATYVLAGFRRRSAASAESSIKYFLLGSFATAFFLYGVALIYGATGTTAISEIAANLREGNDVPLVYLALALMLVGMAFKVSAAPFHVWTPDVYEGAPAPVVAFMSTAPKAAAFALLLRVLFGAFNIQGQWWMPLVWIAAALSMTIGNMGALVQSNIKRMLAYSSIAHAGYILVAVAAAAEARKLVHNNPDSQTLGIGAAIFYTATYAAMNVGAFAVASHFAGAEERYTSIDDYAGLGRRSPVLAATLSIFMLSLIGIPLTGGFFAKLSVFTSALDSGLVWLTVIGLVNSAIAAYYYLRLIVVMYMKDGDDSMPNVEVPMPVAVSLVLAAILTLYLGTMPTAVLAFAREGARALFQ